jgi:pimeloyl-ACP methyl ester carboxylesterase/class 3 adenylate cyclase
VRPPDVRFAKSGEVNIAYSVIGDGEFDIVFVGGWVLSTLEGIWDGPPARFLERLSAIGRLILFDKRGTGLSDRVAGIPNLETRMDDVRAVMDAAGSKRAAIVGVSEGGPMTILFAATYPERVAAAVLFGTGAAFTRADDYPWRTTREERLEWIRESVARLATDSWLTDALEEVWAPSLTLDDAYIGWFRRWVRLSASPSATEALWLMNTDIDVRHVLPSVHMPTLVLHRVGDKDFALDEGRYIADRIPDAELVELEGSDHGWWVNSDQIADPIAPFLGRIWERGDWDLVESERVLATVLFTDIVGSTAKLSEIGDRMWRELIKRHHAHVRRQLVRFAGKEIDTAGDGFFARFDGPARAIRCACAISKAVRELGIEVRQGLHTGECEIVDGKVGGIAVHIGARVAHEANASEVLASSTVRDLVAGSGIRFEDRGSVELKGIPGEWRLFLVDPASAL